MSDIRHDVEWLLDQLTAAEQERAGAADTGAKAMTRLESTVFLLCMLVMLLVLMAIGIEMETGLPARNAIAGWFR